MRPFTRANYKQPALWLAQIVSIFQTHRIRSDDGRYHVVIGALDAEAVQKIADIAEITTGLGQVSRAKNSAARSICRLG